MDFPLHRHGLSKTDCFDILINAGIDLPAMYKLGYNNNNCVGCVKGGIKYWSRILKDFPEHYWKMASQERKMGVSILRDRRGGTSKNLYLDELAKRCITDTEDDSHSMECGVLC